jgi:hypothetical protein
MHTPSYLLLQYLVCVLNILGHIVQHPPSAVHILFGQGALVVQGLPTNNVFLRDGNVHGGRVFEAKKE